MVEFDDVAEAKMVEVASHTVVMAAGHQDGCVTCEPAQRDSVEMVPVEVRQADGVRLEPLNELLGDGWVVPPRAPVTTADDPGIDQQRAAGPAHQEAGMRQDRELHHAPRHELTGFRAGPPVRLATGGPPRARRQRNAASRCASVEAGRRTRKQSGRDRRRAS